MAADLPTQMLSLKASAIHSGHGYLAEEIPQEVGKYHQHISSLCSRYSLFTIIHKSRVWGLLLHWLARKQKGYIRDRKKHFGVKSTVWEIQFELLIRLGWWADTSIEAIITTLRPNQTMFSCKTHTPNVKCVDWYFKLKSTLIENFALVKVGNSNVSSFTVATSLVSQLIRLGSINNLRSGKVVL